VLDKNLQDRGLLGAMEDRNVRKWGNQVERISWLLVLLGMLTQVSTVYAFPSYNVILGFWGAYCSFGKHGRATFVLLVFTILGIVLDITFCAVNSYDSATFQFALVMLILCLFCKLYLLFCGSHFFAALGGAYTDEHGQQNSNYSSMPTPQR
tara:strand:+ start:456 stop:911 length:456 start_codon:yes stop_codon:yes gene_type:complete